MAEPRRKPGEDGDHEAPRPRHAGAHGTRALWAVLLLWALGMLPLLRWGLPDRTRDDLLFGGATPWTAERFNVGATAAQLATRAAGADTDLNPIADRAQPVDLTADEAARAEILRRYRLYSRQPDEMIILRALQRMRPRQGDLDPRLYQYGGAYIYLVGATVGLGAATGFVHVTSDVAYYLEHPEAFARFYIAARLVSLVFGLFTLLAVYRLAGHVGGRGARWVALFGVALLPVFITAVLEAKPHLPSACLLLWATLSALEYRETGARRVAVRMGLQAGLAFGLVLTGLLGAALWPVLVWTTPRGRRKRAAADLAWAAVVFGGTYIVTNPYVLWNALFDPELLTSNLANSTAMYAGQMGRLLSSGVGRTGLLLLLGTGPLPLLLGVAGLVRALRRATRAAPVLVAPAAAFLGMGALLLAGKPAEHARFLILPAIVLAILGAVFVANLLAARRWLGLLALVLLLAGTGGPLYWAAFARDAAGRDEARRRAGELLAQAMSPQDRIAVFQEPAPYAVPPLDFTRRTVVLLPAVQPAAPGDLPEWLILTADFEPDEAARWWGEHYELAYQPGAADGWLTPVTWADKPTFVYRRR